MVLAGFILVLDALQNNPIRTLSSLQKGDDHLYVMIVKGDYGFDKFMKTGTQDRSNATSRPPEDVDWACSCFATPNQEGQPGFGRNFDWSTNTALPLFTGPPHGYASVSMLDAAYLGFSSGNVGMVVCGQQAVQAAARHGARMGAWRSSAALVTLLVLQAAL